MTVVLESLRSNNVAVSVLTRFCSIL